MDKEYQTIGLYPHNISSYEKIKEAYEKESVVGIVHATGTGKSYNALELAYENQDKKIIYVVPANGIIEHIMKIINDNPNLDLKRDFSNVEFRTYQSFVALTRDEIKNINCDFLILDEFHHIGAPVWGARIEELIKTHPNLKIFGMTAYTVRDRKTSYERDMASPDTNELFSRKIVSRYDLCDAMLDGVLPKPIYKSAYINLLALEEKLEEKVGRLNPNILEYKEYVEILNMIKRKIHEAPDLLEILKKNLKPNGKYIYFCPPYSEEGTNDIETIKKQMFEYLKQFIKESDIVFYTSTSEMKELGKNNREAFYQDCNLEGEDVSNKFRIMFAINQYNEGIHAPNIDGVIMGRGTTSDIVYFEQLGRALAVRGNTKEKFDELEKITREELISRCKSRDILVSDTLSKEELIEKLIAPVVIDLTNNYEFIKELENNLKDRIRTRQELGLESQSNLRITNASFDIEIMNQDLFKTLTDLQARLVKTWEDIFELAKSYYEQYGNLLVPQSFKTINGYEVNDDGINLGNWIIDQRKRYNTLTDEKKTKLNSIGFVINTLDDAWNRYYNLAKKYYEHYGNLLIPQKFKTINGIEYAENGLKLGSWISDQRKKFEKLSKERREKLLSIDFKPNYPDELWNKYYLLAQEYYKDRGNLLIPISFKTINGKNFDKNGINLGVWLHSQRTNFTKMSRERQDKLLNIGLQINLFEDVWNEKYNLAKSYYEHHGNLSIPQSFKTINGYEPNEEGIALGKWLSQQRINFAKLSQERKQKLLAIGFKTNLYEDNWNEKFNLAKNYYEHYHNLLIPQSFKTINGIDFDENGIKLGVWLSLQRLKFSKLSIERQQKLLNIGFILNIKKNKEEITNICNLYKIDLKKNKTILDHISIQELLAKIEFLKENNIAIIDNQGILINIFSMSNQDMLKEYNITLEELINKYYISNKKGEL